MKKPSVRKKQMGLDVNNYCSNSVLIQYIKHHPTPRNSGIGFLRSFEQLQGLLIPITATAVTLAIIQQNLPNSIKLFYRPLLGEYKLNIFLTCLPHLYSDIRPAPSSRRRPGSIVFLITLALVSQRTYNELL